MPIIWLFNSCIYKYVFSSFLLCIKACLETLVILSSSKIETADSNPLQFKFFKDAYSVLIKFNLALFLGSYLI